MPSQNVSLHGNNYTRHPKVECLRNIQMEILLTEYGMHLQPIDRVVDMEAKIRCRKEI
ncbi:unnamed protein product, partial [Dicrocoelium dendriticum]